MKLKKVSDTGITRGNSNGERKQEIIFENENNEKYRISIESETYEEQSYARLCKWTNEKGWGVMYNPRSSYL